MGSNREDSQEDGAVEAVGDTKVDALPCPALLSHHDQTTLACLTLAMGILVVGWVTWHGGWQGRLVRWEANGGPAPEFRVDVNRADWPEFTLLPGIGETLGRRIVESRDAEGPFRSVDDLLRVRGIGPRRLERIRPCLWPVQEP